MHTRTIRSSTTLVALIAACAGASAQDSLARATDAWHAARIAQLKAEDGWLNLAGLFWLKEGRNTFGSGPGNDIAFPEGKMEARAGHFLRTGDQVKVFARRKASFTVDGKHHDKAVAFHSPSGTNPTMASGGLRWAVIKREDRIGIRLRDLESPLLESFKGIERFPADPAWHVKARLVKRGEAQTVNITNVLGQTTPQPSPGTLHFELGGVACALDALAEGGELFIIFADPTNMDDTYPSGRFLYAARPDAEGNTVLDFNRAINPPCAFTAFATCPLPPVQNRLPVAVRAGEKRFHAAD